MLFLDFRKGKISIYALKMIQINKDMENLVNIVQNGDNLRGELDRFIFSTEKLLLPKKTIKMWSNGNSKK